MAWMCLSLLLILGGYLCVVICQDNLRCMNERDIITLENTTGSGSKDGNDVKTNVTIDECFQLLCSNQEYNGGVYSAPIQHCFLYKSDTLTHIPKKGDYLFLIQQPSAAQSTITTTSTTTTTTRALTSIDSSSIRNGSTTTQLTTSGYGSIDTSTNDFTSKSSIDTANNGDSPYPITTIIGIAVAIAVVIIVIIVVLFLVIRRRKEKNVENNLVYHNINQKIELNITVSTEQNPNINNQQINVDRCNEKVKNAIEDGINNRANDCEHEHMHKGTDNKADNLQRHDYMNDCQQILNKEKENNKTDDQLDDDIYKIELPDDPSLIQEAERFDPNKPSNIIVQSFRDDKIDTSKGMLNNESLQGEENNKSDDELDDDIYKIELPDDPSLIQEAQPFDPNKPSTIIDQSFRDAAGKETKASDSTEPYDYAYGHFPEQGRERYPGKQKDDDEIEVTENVTYISYQNCK